MKKHSSPKFTKRPIVILDAGFASKKNLQMLKEDTIERNIGKLQKTHPRVRRFYTLTHKNKTLAMTREDEKFNLAESLCGNYVLKTNDYLEAEGGASWRAHPL